MMLTLAIASLLLVSGPGAKVCWASKVPAPANRFIEFFAKNEAVDRLELNVVERFVLALSYASQKP